MKFESIHEYLLELADDPSLAIVSLAMAAKSREVKKMTIERMLDDGRLDEVWIEEVRCVRAHGLIKIGAEEAKRETKLQRILERHAKKRELIYYEPLMRSIGLENNPPNRAIIGRLLGEISMRTYEENGTLLSVIVHKKTGKNATPELGKTLPSSGFFTLAESLGITYESEEALVNEQTAKVFKRYR